MRARAGEAGHELLKDDINFVGAGVKKNRQIGESKTKKTERKGQRSRGRRDNAEKTGEERGESLAASSRRLED
jgi:hypothetical protein